MNATDRFDLFAYEICILKFKLAGAQISHFPKGFPINFATYFSLSRFFSPPLSQSLSHYFSLFVARSFPLIFNLLT